MVVAGSFIHWIEGAPNIKDFEEGAPVLVRRKESTVEIRRDDSDGWMIFVFDKKGFFPCDSQWMKDVEFYAPIVNHFPSE